MDISRREFLKWSVLTGATVALAGCAIPPHQALVSQVEMPEYRLPGESKWFATACQECSGGCGVAVRIIDGRAKKLEGIPEHPVNHGKTCARGQSSLQALYNPDRLTSVLRRQRAQTAESGDWSQAVKALASQMESASAKKGSLLWITGPLYGTTGTLMAALAEKIGAKIWVLDFPGTASVRTAMKSLTGQAHLPYHPLAEADYVINFGNDFLLTGQLPVHDAWQYGEFRQGKERSQRGVLVSFSSRMNLSDANSDRWVPIRPGTEGWVALGIGNALAGSGKKGWPAWASAVSLDTVSRKTGVSADVFARVAKRLAEARHPLAVAGSENGAYSNGAWNVWMVESLNRLLGNPPLGFEPSLLPGLKNIPAGLMLSSQQALSLLQQGRFESVWVFDVNPRYLIPLRLDFEAAFSKAKNKVVFSPFPNETALLADWVLPTQTWLESWGDRLIAGPFGGKMQSAYNLQQPVVMERPESRAAGDILLAAARQAGKGSGVSTVHEMVRKHFKTEAEWENALVRGGAWKSASLDWELYRGSNTHPLYPPPPAAQIAKPPAGASPWEHLGKTSFSGPQEPKFSGQGQVLIPFPSSSLMDGSLANRPWMQELSDAVTTVVWTHWVEIPAGLAQKLNVTRGDVVRITGPGGSLSGPAYPNKALHEEAVAVPVGQGHTHYGPYANRGQNPLAILEPVWQEETGEPAWVGTRVQVAKTGVKARMTVLDERMDRYPKEFMPLT